MPNRTPKPGPRPGAADQQRTPSPVPAAAKTDPTKFGRIDDQGVVYVTRGGEEREIGSWQAGTPEEGLAHYGQRFIHVFLDAAFPFDACLPDGELPQRDQVIAGSAVLAGSIPAPTGGGCGGCGDSCGCGGH